MESSRYWNTNDVGDGPAEGYDRALIAHWLRTIFASGSSGILANLLDELRVSGAASPLLLASGAALVDGVYYENDDELELDIDTPTNGTTGGRVILRADWSAQQIRAAVIYSSDGVPDLPELTQTPGAQYEVNLASFQIKTNGEILNLVSEAARAVMSTDLRAEYLELSGLSALGKAESGSGTGEEYHASDGQVLRRAGTAVGFGQIVTEGLADGAVTVGKLSSAALTKLLADLSELTFNTENFADGAIEDTKLGDRVPQFYRRQGGDAQMWNTPGTSNFAPGAVRILSGAALVVVAAYDKAATVSVTLPIALAKPLLYVSILSAEPRRHWVLALIDRIDNSTITIKVVRHTLYYQVAQDVAVAWMAIGPEE